MNYQILNRGAVPNHSPFLNLQMMIKEIEIKDVGRFKIKHDLLHRGLRPRLKTFDKGLYKEVQFDNYRSDLEQCQLASKWQLGYDYKGNEIQIRVATFATHL